MTSLPEAEEAIPNVTLVRFRTSAQGTFGYLYISGRVFCYTGELPWNGNIRQFSCIPAGSYKCTFAKSPKRGYKVYWLHSVPNRTAVQIHAGNYCGDTRQGYRSHVYGCILLGKKLGKLDGQDAVLVSKTTVRKFFEKMKGKEFILTIKEGF